MNRDIMILAVKWLVALNASALGIFVFWALRAEPYPTEDKE